MTIFGSLISAAEAPLTSELPSRERIPAGQLGDQLFELLSMMNGFYAFDDALHVFPDGVPSALGENSLLDWNSEDLWRHSYPNLSRGLFFFAEDVFGIQFGVGAEGVVSFDPETGLVEPLAIDLLDWASQIMSDCDHLTGQPFAVDWRARFGRLPFGHRLVPKKPFVIGGEFELENMYLIQSATGMRMRAELAAKIADIPDGTTVRIVLDGGDRA